MKHVLVLIHHSTPAPPMGETALFVPFQTAFDAAIALRASDAPAVLVTDSLDAEDLDTLAVAIRERSGQCLEVRLGPWDGETHSPVSGLCRGVISGFGQDGVIRALEYLSREG